MDSVSISNNEHIGTDQEFSFEMNLHVIDVGALVKGYLSINI